MKLRLLAFLSILVLIAGLVPAVAAQDDHTAKLNCLDLSADDCTIVTTAMDNLSTITSFSPTFSLTADIAGAEAVAPGMGLDSSNTVNGSGALVIDHAAVQSDTPYKGVAGSFSVSGSTSDGPFDLSFTLVDGVVYWQDGDTWKGVPVEDVQKYFQEGGALPGMTVMGMDVSPMLGGMMGSMGAVGANPAEAGANLNLGGMNPLSLLELPGFIKQERLADTDLQGQTMQVFAYTGDISVALKAPELQTALSEAMTQAMGAGGAGAQAGGMGAQMGAMLPVLLESTTGTVTVTRWIGADDQFVHQFSLDVDATIDLFGGASTSTKVTPIPPITVKVSVSLSLDKINDTAAPTAPEGATMVDPSELFPEATPAQ